MRLPPIRATESRHLAKSPPQEHRLRRFPPPPRRWHRPATASPFTRASSCRRHSRKSPPPGHRYRSSINPIPRRQPTLTICAEPVWGQWTQTDGQRVFHVHKTQQFPGLDAPQPGPLPGNYQLQLASKPSAAMPARDVFVVAASAVVATLGACAVGLAVSRRRRARPRH